MKIEKVTQRGSIRHIPLEGWKNVVEALVAHDSGLLKSSRATQDKLTQDLGPKADGMGGVLLALTGARNAEGFVKKLLEGMEVVLKSHDHFSKSFDYDAMGTSFFKTTVEVTVLDRKKELYLLGLHAAYVGDKPEEELAKYLGVERALYSQQVVVQIDSLSGGRCAFDFEAILRRLDGVLDSKKVKGDEVVKAFLATDKWSTPSFPFKTDEGLVVTLALGSVERRFKHGDNQQKTETWRPHGAILNCELEESYETKGKKEPAVFVLTVGRPGKNDSNAPIWQPKEKEQVLALANKIAVAFN